MKRLLSVFLLAGGLLVAGGVNAAVTVSIQQSGSDVVVTTIGSLNTAAMGSSTHGNSIGGIWPDYGFIQVGNLNTPIGDQYGTLPNVVATPSVSPYWGSGGLASASSASGVLFAVNFNGGPDVLVPSGYISGSSLAGTLTFASQTLGGLGLNQGTYTLTFGSGADTDSVTVYVLPTPTVTSITPTSGSTAGGTVITITGTNLTGATGITVGGTACTAFNVASATSATCTTPAGTAGTASVVVSTSGGSNAANTLFTYTAAPASIPSLSEWSQMLLGLLVMTMIGWQWRKQQSVGH